MGRDTSGPTRLSFERVLLTARLSDPPTSASPPSCGAVPLAALFALVIAFLAWPVEGAGSPTPVPAAPPGLRPLPRCRPHLGPSPRPQAREHRSAACGLAST